VTSRSSGVGLVDLKLCFIGGSLVHKGQQGDQDG
jgi:hypothetical protein